MVHLVHLAAFMTARKFRKFMKDTVFLTPVFSYVVLRKQEVNDQTLVGKRADLAMFGVSVAAVALSKREEASSGKRNSLM